MLVRSIAALRYKIIITGAYKSVEYAIGTIAVVAFAFPVRRRRDEHDVG